MTSDTELAEPDNRMRFDPVYVHASREAIVLLVAFALFLVWTLSVCVWLGYRESDAPVPLTWGMPSWVFWGVAIPWLAANIFTVSFAVWMKDDPLEHAETENEMPSESSCR